MRNTLPRFFHWTSSRTNDPRMEHPKLLNRPLLGLFIFTLLCSVNLDAQNLEPRWLKQIKSTSSVESYSIDIDASGNVYLLGQFLGDADFDPDAGVETLTFVPSFYNVTIAKFDLNGNYIWAKSLGKKIGGTDSYIKGESIKVNSLGEIYITGWFDGTIDFDPSTAANDTLHKTSAGGYDMYLEKLDANGNLIWINTMGNLSSDRAYDMFLDASQKPVITGSFARDLDWNPQGAPFIYATPGFGANAFIASYNTDGTLDWVKDIASTTTNTYANALCKDPSGSIFVTGYYLSSPDFDPSAGTATVTSAGNYDAFIAKYDATGNYQWVSSLGTNRNQFGEEVAADASGNVYVAGTFTDSIDVDPTAGVDMRYTNGSQDYYMAKYNSAGTIQWAYTMGGAGYDAIKDIITTSTGNILFLTSFSGTMDFDPSGTTLNYTAPGSTYNTMLSEFDPAGNLMDVNWFSGNNTANITVNQMVADAADEIYLTGNFSGSGGIADMDPSSDTLNITANSTSSIFFGKYGPPCISDQTLTASAGTISCAGSDDIMLGSSESGVDYYLRNDADSSVVDGPVAGTGSSIVLNTGTIDTTTTFHVFAEIPATCTLVMAQTVTITVTNTAPVLSNCPNDTTIYGPVSGCQAVVNWTPPTVADDCNPSPWLFSTHNPGDTFNLGTTTVTYTASDSSVGGSSVTEEITIASPPLSDLSLLNYDGTNLNTINNGVAYRATHINRTTGKLYAIVGNDIIESDLDGSNMVTLVSGLSAPTDMEPDFTAGYIFWAEYTGRRVMRCDLDGNNQVVIFSTLPSGDRNFGLGLDKANQKVYWVDHTPASSASLWSSNYDGTGDAQIGADLFGVTDVYPSSTKIYFTVNSSTGTGSIGYRNLSTLATTTLISGENAYTMMLSEDGSEIIWYDQVTDEIYKCDTNGVGQTTIATGIASGNVLGKAVGTIPAASSQVNKTTCSFNVTVLDTVNHTLVQTISGCDSVQVFGTWYYASQTINDTLFGGAANGCDSIVTTNVTINASPADQMVIPSTINTGLIARYELSGNLNDLSGNGYNGTMIGTESYVADRNANPNEALAAVSSAYANLGASFLMNETSVSAAGWIYRVAGGSTVEGLFGQDDQLEIYVFTSSGALNIWNGTPISTGVNVPLNTWTHIAYVAGPSGQKVYVNGAEVFTTATPYNPNANTSSSQPATIGRAANMGTFSMSGYADEVRFYSREISVAEVEYLADIFSSVSLSGENICTGSTANISVSPSETGVNYYLRYEGDTNNLAGPVAGNGGVITLISPVLSTDTVFTVFADNGSCQQTLSDTAGVFIIPPSTFAQSITDCDSSLINGTMYYTSQVVVDTLAGAAATGCDSIVTTTLTINYTQTGTDAITTCDSALVNGNMYYTSQVIVDTLTAASANGCDSVVTTTLTINFPQTGTDAITSCDSVLVNGTMYYTSQIVVDTLPAASSNGCDSIVTTILTINYPQTSTDAITGCDSALVNGNMYYTSQIVIDTLPSASANGCDSIVTTTLTINYTQTGTDAITGCDSVMVNGTMYYTSQTVVDTLPGASANGCDSVATTTLTINYTQTGTDAITSCDSAFINGNMYYASQIVVDTLPGASSNGCDSVVTTTLTLNYTVVQNVADSICSGDSIFLGGNYQFTTGTYYDTLSGASSTGCDSVVVTNLVVRNLPTVVANASSDTLCLGDSTILFGTGADAYSWNNGITDSVGFVPMLGTETYTVTGTGVNGCINTDSIAIVAVQDATVPTLDAVSVEYCESDIVQALSATAGSGSITWYADSGLSTVLGTGSTYLPTLNLGTNTIYVNEVLGSCASESVAATVILYENPVVSADGSGNFDANASMQLSATETGAVSIVWSPGALVSDSTILNPTINATETTNFVITVTSADGCQASDSVLVELNQIIANFVSPNGDGINDTWEIRPLSTVSGCAIRIFDGLGNAVYFTDDYQNEWNATTNDGSLMPVGVYYFTIDCGGATRSGSITVVR